MNLGKKIKEMRLRKGVSQEQLAHHLGISFQAVSKWENQLTMPDITLLAPIANFFGITIDELLSYNKYETQKDIERIVDEHSKVYDTDKTECERIIREGLKKYPANEILLNCLVGVLPLPERASEVISTCLELADCAEYDETRYDAYRILAEAYVSKNEYDLAAAAIEKIPEIYFTKLSVKALLLRGEESYEAAVKQKNISFGHLIDMLIVCARYHAERGELEKANIQLDIAEKIIHAFSCDFYTEYTRAPSQAYLEIAEKINTERAAIGS